jgi:hypothetical protein
MEEPGMGRRTYAVWAGLLRALLALGVAVFPVHAQSADVLDLSIEADTVLPEPGHQWLVVILVDHPVPVEVRVRPPAFPPSLHLERVRVLPRVKGDSRQTTVEYEFSVLWENSFTLGSFEINVPGKRGLTQPFAVRPAGSASSNAPVALLLPRLFWTMDQPPSPNAGSPPKALHTGEAAELALRYVYPPGGSLPPEIRSQSAAAWSYRPTLPENAILEVLPGPPQPDAVPETGVLLRLRVIPLKGPAFSLRETRLTLNGHPLTVPSLEAPIAP